LPGGQLECLAELAVEQADRVVEQRKDKDQVDQSCWVVKEADGGGEGARDEQVVALDQDDVERASAWPAEVVVRQEGQEGEQHAHHYLVEEGIPLAARQVANAVLFEASHVLLDKEEACWQNQEYQAQEIQNTDKAESWIDTASIRGLILVVVFLLLLGIRAFKAIIKIKQVRYEEAEEYHGSWIHELVVGDEA